MRTLSIIGIFFICAFLITCTRKQFEPLVCFQDDILPIYVTKCAMTGCHDGSKNGAGKNLTSYDGIMRGISAKHPLNSQYYTIANGANAEMPPKPNPKLTSEELSLIKKWISDGARNTSGCKGCDTTQFSYSGKISLVVNTWCVGCHNGAAGTPYNLTTYAGVKSAIEAPNNPFLGSVKHLTGFSAMPKGTNTLSDCDIKAIQLWISAGYPNN